MLRVALRNDTAFRGSNPGASLPWVISTLIILCVALSEEMQMYKVHGQAYEQYRTQAPFLFPLPGFLARIVSAPFRLILRKDQPTSHWDLIWTFVIYLAVIMLLSLPFVFLDWPTNGWMNWPFS